MSDDELKLLESLSDGEFQPYKDAFKSLMLHNLADKPLSRLEKIDIMHDNKAPNLVYITDRGRNYLRYYHQQEHLRQLAESTHSLAKEASIINKIIVAATLFTVAYTLVSCLTKTV